MGGYFVNKLFDPESYFCRIYITLITPGSRTIFLHINMLHNKTSIVIGGIKTLGAGTEWIQIFCYIKGRYVKENVHLGGVTFIFFLS